MLPLPNDMFALLASFAPLFSRRVWRYVPVLVVGALLTPGRRMVSTALRSVGLGQIAHFQNYHRVLNRAVWSSLAASHILLDLLVQTFVPQGPLVFGIDETIERRRGAKIAAAGIYRDPVRSSHSHFVKVNGLRWIAVMLLVPIPWASRVWALPFLTVLAPSDRYAQERGARHKPVPVWARQVMRQIHRWCPDRTLVVVGDRAYATLELLDALRPIATVVTRLRLDARLFAPPPPRAKSQKGRPRLVGARQPTPAARSGMDDRHALSRLSLRRRFGILRASHPSRSAGCLCATPQESSRPKHCSVPTWRLRPTKSWLGSYNAGSSK